ncbi:MAG: FAD-binding oxidoreductase [Candidatus Helarchaeales archaeon]
MDKDVFKRIVEIVGEKNVSIDPVIRQGYAFNWGNDTVNIERGQESTLFINVPIAVVLPGSTEEVQKLVKLLDEVGLKFKAQSTGLGPWTCASTDETVIVDLRRMNKIRKIDPKNMYAVVEPYVTGGTLQAELIKINLNCHMPGAGPMVSPLASSTSMCGPGFTSESTGFSGRNVLGTEWVLPTGEVLRLGSLGLETDPDWYTGDGPGFSLRGVMRGASGTKSGLGIFTACAIKLYPYPCEPKWEFSGVAPDYEFEIPNYMSFHVLSYKNYEGVEHAMYRISEEELAFMLWSTTNLALAALLSKNKAELMTNATKFVRLKKPLVVLLCGRTKREIEYKKKMLAKIVEETNGKDMTERGFVKVTSRSYGEALRSMMGFHGFIATGSFQSSFGGIDSIGVSFNMVKVNIPIKKKYTTQKLLPDDQGESHWITTYEHGHYAHAEMPTMYNVNVKKSRQAMVDYFHESNDAALKEHLNIPFFIEGDELHDKWGPYVCNYNVWLRKIKETFDPNNTSDSGFYISTTKELEKKKQQS